ncbi:hypothetical protein KI387_032236 [Taxus chinensis]|uniref:MORF/ORRM1/DAG-like MORF domain-containing protein n=1 Tax=Taxus chinensis TaxID=29808 RepID=A0AA38BYT6_TAXCH|nr:hypothetical protein KI387_032236 [Taxus chinensis]
MAIMALRLRRAVALARAFSTSPYAYLCQSSSPGIIQKSPVSPIPSGHGHLSGFNHQSLLPSRCTVARCRVSNSGSVYSPLDSNNSGQRPTLFEGCDYNHWLVTMEWPEPQPTREEKIDCFVKTLANIVGSEEEAKKRIYALSTTTYQGFMCEISEELSEKIKKEPGVEWVLPDSYGDPINKTYGVGDKYINGVIIPDTKTYNNRSSGRDRPRNRRRDSMPLERRDVQINRNPLPPIGGRDTTVEVSMQGDKQNHRPAMDGKDPMTSDQQDYRPLPMDGRGQDYRPPPMDGRGQDYRSPPMDGRGQDYRLPPMDGRGQDYRPLPMDGRGQDYRQPPMDGRGQDYRPPPMDGSGQDYRPPPMDGRVQDYRPPPMDSRVQDYRPPPMEGRGQDYYRSPPMEGRGQDYYRPPPMEGRGQDYYRPPPMEGRGQDYYRPPTMEGRGQDYYRPQQPDGRGQDYYRLPKVDGTGQDYRPSTLEGRGQDYRPPSLEGRGQDYRTPQINGGTGQDYYRPQSTYGGTGQDYYRPPPMDGQRGQDYRPPPIDGRGQDYRASSDGRGSLPSGNQQDCRPPTDVRVPTMQGDHQGYSPPMNSRGPIPGERRDYVPSREPMQGQQRDTMGAQGKDPVQGGEMEPFPWPMEGTN